MKGWLLPGIGLKRWIGVSIVGGFLSGLGLGNLFATYIDALFILLGLFLVVAGFLKFFLSLDFELRKRGVCLEHIYTGEYRKDPNVVAIGGGTGLSTLLKGLKRYTSNLTAVVAVSDEGGSTGRIRKEWGGVGIGDIRNCLLSLADESNPWVPLLSYRFERGELRGHSLGNLVLLALAESEGNFLSGVNRLKEMLGIKAKVYPVTLSDVRLKAYFEDGSVVEGETEIPRVGKRITGMEIIPPKASVTPHVVESISRADIVVIGPGSLYTSIIPNLLFKDMVDAIVSSRAVKVYVCNIMTQPGETIGFTVVDHIREIEKYLGAGSIDYVIVNIGTISPEILKRYKAEGAEPVKIDKLENMVRPILVYSDLVSEFGEVVRHDPYKLAELILRIFKEGRS
ncbi:MAG: hypothetical protein PWQ16_1283 [bacterium]|nr:hypothetical protein [bacterium]